MITFCYQNHTGVYDNLTRTVTWNGKTFDYAKIPNDMRIQIENASC